MKPQGFISDEEFEQNIGFISDVDFEQTIGLQPQAPSTDVKMGGVSVRTSSRTAEKLFQPNLVNVPGVRQAQQYGTQFARGLFDVGAGVVKGGAETVRQMGEFGGAIQSGVTSLTGLEGGRTSVYNEGEAFDQFTTPEGAMQKGGYLGETAAEIAPTAPVVAKASLGGIKLGIKAMGNLIEKGLNKLNPSRLFIKQMDNAVEMTMPRLTPTAKESAFAQGRVTQPGLLKASKVTPNEKDLRVAESVADIIYRKTPTEAVSAIDRRVSQINDEVGNFVYKNKVPFNQNQLRAKLNSGKDDLRLVFTSDATAERTYDAVVDIFLENVQKGDTYGLFKARQAVDNIPAIRQLLENDKLGENARKQIVLAIRRAANEFISDQLPANNPYKALMKKENLMLEALGNIAERNRDVIGKNQLQLLTEKYPALKWAVGGAVGAAGIGVGGSIIGSTD